MSIGYETQIAPINTVTFYNAIANNGRMMRPRFVKEFQKDGQVIFETEPEVIKEQIAKPQTIKTMQTILRHVVSQGLGKKAGTPILKVAGKTATTQVGESPEGDEAIPEYNLAFCGYFPADKPKYSMIVSLNKLALPASGGAMAGEAFHNIVEWMINNEMIK
jgi:cell division protein FtsI (penicillin-binding protein 3)